jgi:RNA polymerase sigma factor for flagellar operon FliA
MFNPHRPAHLSNSTLESVDLPPYPGIALQAVHLVNSRQSASKALAALLSAKAVGFDTESKPTFHKGEISSGPHLVQLATTDSVYLFQTAQLRSTQELKAILEAPQLLKVGFGLGNDRSALKSRLDIELRNTLDLGEELRALGHRGTVGAKMAVAHFFGQKLQKSKKISTSNWATPHLSERQILYAANDALVALQIYRAWIGTAGADQSAPA